MTMVLGIPNVEANWDTIPADSALWLLGDVDPPWEPGVAPTEGQGDPRIPPGSNVVRNPVINPGDEITWTIVHPDGHVTIRDVFGRALRTMIRIPWPGTPFLPEGTVIWINTDRYTPDPGSVTIQRPGGRVVGLKPTAPLPPGANNWPRVQRGGGLMPIVNLTPTELPDGTGQTEIGVETIVNPRSTGRAAPAPAPQTGGTPRVVLIPPAGDPLTAGVIVVADLVLILVDGLNQIADQTERCSAALARLVSQTFELRRAFDDLAAAYGAQLQRLINWPGGSECQAWKADAQQRLIAAVAAIAGRRATADDAWHYWQGFTCSSNLGLPEQKGPADLKRLGALYNDGVKTLNEWIAAIDAAAYRCGRGDGPATPKPNAMPNTAADADKLNTGLDKASHMQDVSLVQKAQLVAYCTTAVTYLQNLVTAADYLVTLTQNRRGSFDEGSDCLEFWSGKVSNAITRKGVIESQLNRARQTRETWENFDGAWYHADDAKDAAPSVTVYLNAMTLDAFMALGQFQSDLREQAADCECDDGSLHVALSADVLYYGFPPQNANVVGDGSEVPFYCSLPSSCPPDRPICHNGVCVQCVTNDDCPDGLHCDGGVCVPDDPPSSPPTLDEMRLALGTAYGQSGYNPNADLDGDGDVDFQDLAIWRRLYGG